MTDWVPSTPGQDFASRYITASHVTPLHMADLNGSLPWGVGEGPDLGFSPSPTKAHDNSSSDRGQDGSSFCQRNNVDDCVAFLNQEVMMFGLPSLYESASGTFDIVRLVNCTHELLNRASRNIRLKEELEDRLNRSECDRTTLQETVTRLKSSMESVQRDLAMSQEKERQMVYKHNQLLGKLKAEKEEVKRLHSVMAHRETQFRHEVRKKEREGIKLKDRLNRLLSDKTQERKLGMEISYSLQRPDGKRGRWNAGQKQEEEMYRVVISDYEERQKELLVENTELRRCLGGMQKELVTLLNAPNTDTQNTSQTQFDDIDGDSDDHLSDISLQDKDVDELSEGHFQMPYTIVRDGIEKSLKAKCRLLKKYISQIEKQRRLKSVKESEKADGKESPVESRSSTRNSMGKARDDGSSSKEVERLKKQSERYKEIIAQQEQFIQQNLELQDAASAENSILRDSYLWDEWETLQRDKRHFKQQRGHLDADKKNLQDKQNMLEMERREFESEKANVLKQNFLEMTPFGGRQQKPRRQRLLPATPSFSPAPAESRLPLGSTSTPLNTSKNPMDMPTTVELYRTLGLFTEQNGGHTGTGLQSSQEPHAFSRVPVYDNPLISPNTSYEDIEIKMTAQDLQNANDPTEAQQEFSNHHHINSSVSSDRITEHMENIKLTLFQQQHANDNGND